MKSASRLAECPPDVGAEVAFAGRSNAGKSSAINTITRIGKLARTSKTPGRTQLINFFSLHRAGCRLVDLPGYGYAKVDKETQAQWQAHLNDYMQNRMSLKGLVQVMDIRHPLSDFDMMMLDWCNKSHLPVMILLTKADKLKYGAAKQTFLKVRQTLSKMSNLDCVVIFSSTNQTGLEEAQLKISTWLEAGILTEEAEAAGEAE